MFYYADTADKAEFIITFNAFDITDGTVAALIK